MSGVGRDERMSRIAESTIDLAHALGLRVVAEGIEWEHDRQVLRSLGCDAIQGYLLTPPLPADAMAGWLTERGRGALAA